MIQLFNIPDYTINTSQFSNVLHDKTVREFEKSFAQYVGAKYAVSFNSATSAIFLIFKYLLKQSKTAFIPSIIPPVVPNAIINAGCKVFFTNNTTWVGNSYSIATFEDYQIIDSAQRVDRNQFQDEAEDEDLMIFSFYPTKPIGSCDGGMVVSNDEDKIELLRELTFNGMSQEQNNWERRISSIGWKMYLNSIQAYIANENLKKLDDKKSKLKLIRDEYNDLLQLNNTSDHLYRIGVDNNKKFLNFAKQRGIVCGIHYQPLHSTKLYNQCDELPWYPESQAVGDTTVSIPFHEKLSLVQIRKVVACINEYR